MKKIEKILIKFNKCPLCRHSKIIRASKPYKNRYSDQISQLLKISEDSLLEKTKNVKCKNCGLIYKTRWFKKKFYKKVLDELAPVHPRGWDTNSKRFSKNGLRKEFGYYLKEVYKSNSFSNKNLRASQRKLSSIVDSIITKSSKQRKFKKNFLKKIVNNDVNFIQANQNKISKLLNKPERFKRFKNFSDEPMFDYINKHVKDLNYYGEVGCPLWGMLKIAKKSGCKTKFIKGDKYYFWNNKCKKNKKTCCSAISKNVNFTYKDLESFNGEKLDFLGIFNYFDHLTDPSKYIKKLLPITKSLGFIFEINNKDGKGVPVQHFTGWSKKTMLYIARKYNMKVDSNFRDIRKSGNEFFLLH